MATGLFRGTNAKLGPGTNHVCSPLLAGSHLPSIPPYQVAGGTLGRVRAGDWSLIIEPTKRNGFSSGLTALGTLASLLGNGTAADLLPCDQPMNAIQKELYPCNSTNRKASIWENVRCTLSCFLFHKAKGRSDKKGKLAHIGCFMLNRKCFWLVKNKWVIWRMLACTCKHWQRVNLGYFKVIFTLICEKWMSSCIRKKGPFKYCVKVFRNF